METLLRESPDAATDGPAGNDLAQRKAPLEDLSDPVTPGISNDSQNQLEKDDSAAPNDE